MSYTALSCGNSCRPKLPLLPVLVLGDNGRRWRRRGGKAKKRIGVGGRRVRGEPKWKVEVEGERLPMRVRRNGIVRRISFQIRPLLPPFGD
jgi:hypothetical protein